MVEMFKSYIPVCAMIVLTFVGEIIFFIIVLNLVQASRTVMRKYGSEGVVQKAQCLEGTVAWLTNTILFFCAGGAEFFFSFLILAFFAESMGWLP